MSMTLGRFSTTEDPEAGSLRQSGDEVSFESLIVGTSTADMQAKVQQLRGLVDNPDESVFPFTWSEDSTFDGFYTDIEVEVNDTPAMYAAWNVPFRVRMRRVGGYATPQFEWILQQAIRTNSHGITVSSTTGILPGGAYAVPTSAVEFKTGFSAAGTASRTSDEGALTVAFSGAAVGDVALASYFIAPASRYVGTCKIEVSYGGTFYPMIGQQIPTGAAWRISNGLIRMSVSGGALVVQPYDGTQWETATNFQMGTAAGLSGTLTSISTARVIRNSPDLCVIRCTLIFSGGITWGVQTIDVSVSTGARHIEVSLVSTGDSDWYVQPSSSTACTALTGGFRATSNDAGGNRFVLSAVQAQTNTLASGRLMLSAAGTAFTYMIGFEVGGSGAASHDAAQQVIYKFFQALGTRQNVVVR